MAFDGEGGPHRGQHRRRPSHAEADGASDQRGRSEVHLSLRLGEQYARKRELSARLAADEGAVGRAVPLSGVAGVVQPAQVEVSDANQQDGALPGDRADDDGAGGGDATHEDQRVDAEEAWDVDSSRTWCRTAT